MRILRVASISKTLPASVAVARPAFADGVLAIAHERRPRPLYECILALVPTVLRRTKSYVSPVRRLSAHGSIGGPRSPLSAHVIIALSPEPRFPGFGTDEARPGTVTLFIISAFPALPAKASSAILAYFVERYGSESSGPQQSIILQPGQLALADREAVMTSSRSPRSRTSRRTSWSPCSLSTSSLGTG
jgi:hypothetical protein